jgi:class 3 adenylate cyclase
LDLTLVYLLLFFVLICNSGNEATFLGRGDLHDPDYQHMRLQRNFTPSSQGQNVHSKYTGIPVDEEYCTFTVTMYPSTDMENQFISSNPIIIASFAVLIFLFTSMVFIIYDSKVEQRQNIVTNRAAKTSAVLSSLFPTAVRDKLLSQEDFDPRSNNNDNFDVVPRTMSQQENVQHKDVLGSTDGMNMNQDLNDDKIDVGNNYCALVKQKFASPIADLYPDTTVFFADIRGFTAWSSSRSPVDVFILLEALYSEFDKIAQRRKVFKVETIGDSYVAVAGLPEPMSQHATIMARFAEDVLLKMKHVVTELSTCFGPDTADLTLRVGLNSGPTTAGVIRGEKSRYQLFGDTVNTAARMESTGRPGMVQCSQKTADLLLKAGKVHWLTQREDVVFAKGKGDMTTYWIQIQPRSVYSTTGKKIRVISESIESLIPQPAPLQVQQLEL